MVANVTGGVLPCPRAAVGEGTKGGAVQGQEYAIPMILL